jgi:hypothetical protein
MSRFDYVKYDQSTQASQAVFKARFEELETVVNNGLPDGRAKSLVLTKLEEAYMWVGKGLRDVQLQRNPQAEHNEARG